MSGRDAGARRLQSGRDWGATSTPCRTRSTTPRLVGGLVKRAHLKYPWAYGCAARAFLVHLLLCEAL